MNFLRQFKNLTKKIIPSQVYWLPNYYLFLKRFNFNKYKVVLDAGCGESILLDYFSKKGVKVFGVDVSKWSTEQANNNYNNIFFILADINNLPFKNNSFDAVLSSGAIECVKNPEVAFREMHRVLKSKAKCIITMTKRYECTGSLFTAQRFLRKIVPKIVYTHDLPDSRAWLEYSSEEMAKKLGHVSRCSQNDISKMTEGLFSILYSEYYIKLFSALAKDFVYGIKGFYYFRFILFFFSTRIDHYIYRKMPGYLTFIEMEKLQ